MKSKVKLIHGECLAEMAKLKDQSVDLILCDLPYGTTACKWDAIIDPVRMWKEYKRICTGAIVLTAAQPFTSALVMSNPKMFRYQWVWEKQKPTNFLKARLMPLRSHEDVLVFCVKGAPYYPQGLTEVNIKSGRANKVANGVYRASDSQKSDYVQKQGNFPRSILRIPTDTSNPHPSAKPVALMEYMVKTYTNEGMTVLDNCMGSGTTGVACVNLKRNFIGIEQDPTYFAIAKKRIADAQ